MSEFIDLFTKNSTGADGANFFSSTADDVAIMIWSILYMCPAYKMSHISKHA